MSAGAPAAKAADDLGDLDEKKHFGSEDTRGSAVDERDLFRNDDNEAPAANTAGAHESAPHRGKTREMMYMGVEHFRCGHVAVQVRARKLKPPWSELTADGCKFFECVKRGAGTRNPLKNLPGWGHRGVR